MNIGISQIEASYKVAKEVYSSSIKASESAKQLGSEDGMSVSSAKYYISAFRCMMEGDVFKRTISVVAADYYLSKIFSEFGAVRLSLALSSIGKHIEYREGQAKTNLHKLRAVLSNHELSVGLINFEKLQAEFTESVKQALNDTPVLRALRLKSAPTKPKKISVNVDYFIRNRDVVAEVLHRAGGVCGRCGEAAPFLKKKDGMPYLEVHHKKQLAQGGEDVVSNAIALCPNCHRQAHFGRADA